MKCFGGRGSPIPASVPRVCGNRRWCVDPKCITQVKVYQCNGERVSECLPKTHGRIVINCNQSDQRKTQISKAESISNESQTNQANPNQTKKQPPGSGQGTRGFFPEGRPNRSNLTRRNQRSPASTCPSKSEHQQQRRILSTDHLESASEHRLFWHLFADQSYGTTTRRNGPGRLRQ